MTIGPWSYTLSRISTMGAALERLIDKQVCTSASFTESRIILLAVLNILANDGDFAVSLDPEAVRFTEMIAPLSGDYSCHTIRRHAVLPPNSKSS
jgi:hypothetical protein